MGYLILLPLGILGWIAIKAINYSVHGGARRLVGVVSCPVLGGIMFMVGRWMAFEGSISTEWRADGLYEVTTTYPIAGWIGIVVGAIYVLVGTLWSAFGHSKWEDENS